MREVQKGHCSLIACSWRVRTSRPHGSGCHTHGASAAWVLPCLGRGLVLAASAREAPCSSSRQCSRRSGAWRGRASCSSGGSWPMRVGGGVWTSIPPWHSFLPTPGARRVPGAPFPRSAGLRRRLQAGRACPRRGRRLAGRRWVLSASRSTAMGQAGGTGPRRRVVVIGRARTHGLALTTHGQRCSTWAGVSPRPAIGAARSSHTRAWARGDRPLPRGRGGVRSPLRAR